MIYMKLQGNVFPYYEGDVRLENPSMGDIFVLPNGFVEVEIQADPVYDKRTQTIEYGNPYEQDGIWKADKVVRQMTKKELSEANALPSQIQTNPEIAEIMSQIEQELGLSG